MRKALRRFRASLKSYSRNATERYVSGVAALLVLGVAGEFGAAYLHASDATISLLRALSDALLISGLLATLVDPYLKRRLEDDSSWSAIFGYLNPKAPKELRDALQELAVCQLYYSSVVCRVHFEWASIEQKVLGVRLDLIQTGTNLDVEPYKPTERPWVLASTDNWQSEYLRYSLSCPRYIPHLDVIDGDLEDHVDIQPDGSLVLNEGAIVGDNAIPSGVDFERTYRTKMYRHANGYVPFQHSHFTERIRVVLTGPALRDLDVRVTHPQPAGIRQPMEWKRLSTDTSTTSSHDFRRATAGQVTLVSWYPVSNSHR